MNLPKRKPNRLKNYNSNEGAYFITICTKDKRCLLWQEKNVQQSGAHLSNEGLIVDKAINNISKYYPDTLVDKYVSST